MTPRCPDERRRDDVRRSALYGVDYVEVGANPHVLKVVLLGAAPPRGADELRRESFRIDGGERIRDVEVTRVVVHRAAPGFDDWLELTVAPRGDASTYMLRVVDAHRGTPRADFDARYDHATFRFDAAGATERDCADGATPATPAGGAPVAVDYLAKDYASFRQLVLDRLSLLMPDWQERHVPDIGVAVVESFAYVADHLSQYQDAVATEAYLGTARRRVSVRRHARLVDYAMHEGCNARALVTVEVDAPLTIPSREICFVAAEEAIGGRDGGVVAAEELAMIAESSYEVFEPMTGGPLRLVPAHNRIGLYTWGDGDCALPAGAVRATLRDEGLALAPGDLLVFEEVASPATGVEADADPTRRHAVRLRDVTRGVDRLYGTPIVEIEWDAADALPFPFTLAAIGPAPWCARLEDLTVARGNVVLVDHGATLRAAERLGTVDGRETVTDCLCVGEPDDPVLVPARFRPRLQRRPLVWREPLVGLPPAAALLRHDPRRAKPQISVCGLRPTAAGIEQTSWEPRRDLLASDADAPHFVAECDDDGDVQLRFGDGDCGRMPDVGTIMMATYRVGGGVAGNVGAEAIRYALFRNGIAAPLRVRNPLPARGGAAPERVDEVRTFAPRSARRVLERAVTASDYARLAERHSRVQRAAATMHWLGTSWLVRVAIDERERRDPAPSLLEEVRAMLHHYRRIGHEVVVTPPAFVPLDVSITVDVRPHVVAAHVKSAVLEQLGSGVLPDGTRAFFHPDNMTFGTSIAASALVAAARAVDGVDGVEMQRLSRYGSVRRDVPALLRIGPREIPRVDNDPSMPERGTLEVVVRGAR